ncbi:hypothetical protein QYF36_009977 [Acer negundo]|nr:hypothetical protein QYF36_009977 [Acer negundo]
MDSLTSEGGFTTSFSIQKIEPWRRLRNLLNFFGEGLLLSIPLKMEVHGLLSNMGGGRKPLLVEKAIEDGLLADGIEKMNQNTSSLLIGLVGAVITLSAYSQTLMSSTQCIGVGLFVLMFGLLVREGFISL